MNNNRNKFSNKETRGKRAQIKFSSLVKETHQMDHLKIYGDASKYQIEKIAIKVNDFQEGIHTVLLQLRSRIIGSLYVIRDRNNEIKVHAVVNKIMELVNRKTLGVTIDGNYVCRIPPFKENDIAKALMNALKNRVSELEAIRCPIKSIELELIKEFKNRGFKFCWKKWIRDVQFDFLVMILRDRQVLFDVIEGLNYELLREMQRKLRLIQRIAEKYDLDLVYYCVRKEDICKSVPQFLNLLERILLGKEVRPSGLLMMRSPKVDNSGNGIRVLFKRRIASDKSGRQEYYIDILTAKKSDVKLVRSIRLSDKLSMNVQRICDAMYNDLGVHYDFKFDAYVNLLNNIMNKGFMIMIMKPMLRKISNEVNEKSIESVDASRRDENQEDKNNQRCEVK